MKKIFFVPLVVLVVVVLDIANRAFCQYAYSNVPENSTMEGNYIYELNRHCSDLLVVGASRAVHHYNTPMMEDSLGLKCFNAGMDGEGIVYQYLCICRALQNSSLKYVILDLGESQVDGQWDFQTKSYRIYYWQNDSARSYYDSVEPLYKRLFMLSSFYQYNGRFVNAIRCFAPSDNRTNKGYSAIPYNGSPSDYIFWEKDEPFSISEEGLDYMKRIVKLCKDNNVELILCLSPTLIYNPNYSKCISEFAKQNSVRLFDNSHNPDFVNDRYLFKDAVHLNEVGADKYTRTLIHFLNIHMAEKC